MEQNGAAAQGSPVYATPAVTHATSSSVEELNEAVSYLLPASALPCTFAKCSGGVNNKVYYVTTAQGDKIVLRIYNNGGNTARTLYEHAVLQQLASANLDFAVPELLLSPTGESFRVLKSGTTACLFRLISGRLASLKSARAIGKATAELVAALAKIKIDLPLPNPLYRNIYDAHHKMSRDLFKQVVAEPSLDSVRESVNFLAELVASSERLIENINTQNLPEQQIHADCHSDNVLVSEDGETVTAILDFEFSAWDWRVMELAVGLSKYVGQKDIEPTFEQWVLGYREGGGRLTLSEIKLLPDLIILRILSNVVYFAGRAASGEDTIEPLASRAEMYANRCKWIETRRDWMVDLLTKSLLQ